MELPFILEDIEVCNTDGKKIPVKITASLIQIGDKKVISGFFRDISELQSSQKRFQRLAEATFEGIVTHDNGVFVEANQQFADMFGYSLEELKGVNGLDLFALESREIAREKIASGDPGPYEATCTRKDGSTFPVEIRARAIELKGKQLRIAVCKDLTQQKKLQQQLVDNERKYRELYKNARACLYRTRISDGMLLDCSRATARLFGYADGDEYKNSFSVTSTYVDPQQRQSLIEALQKDKRVHNFQLQLKRKDGTPLWVAMSAEIFPKQGFIEGAMRDITVMKALTKTESEILDHLMQGMSNKEIAFEMGRSRRTVEDHRASIMKKLEVDNIVDLTRMSVGP
jgi:PAS domain S-box-containing protein